MKTVSSALNTHFGLDCTTLAVLWKLTTQAGVKAGFTTHDKNITYNDGIDTVTYLADTGMVNSAASAKADMSVDNQEVTAFLDSDSISEVDIRNGVYNYAVIEIRVVNWADLTMGDLKVKSGTVGQIVMKNGMFTAEVRGLTQYLTTVVGSLYGPLCRAELGSGYETPGGIITFDKVVLNGGDSGSTVMDIAITPSQPSEWALFSYVKHEDSVIPWFSQGGGSSIASWSISAGTLTVVGDNNLTAGQTVVVSAMAATELDGESFTVAAATSGGWSAPTSLSDGSSAGESGIASVQGWLNLTFDTATNTFYTPAYFGLMAAPLDNTKDLFPAAQPFATFYGSPNNSQYMCSMLTFDVNGITPVSVNAGKISTAIPTYTWTVTEGNTVLVWAICYDAWGDPVITDTQNNEYTIVSAQSGTITGTGPVNVIIATAVASASGSNTLTLAWTLLPDLGAGFFGIVNEMDNISEDGPPAPVIDPTSHYKCGINLALWRQTGSVISSADAVTIVPNGPGGSPASPGLLMVGSATPTLPAPAGWFNDGIITFTSGVMNGLSLDMKSWDGETITMFLPMPYQPAPGDTFTIEPGCDKLNTTCYGKFNNIVNHRGESFIPGNDLLLLYPDAQ